MPLLHGGQCVTPLSHFRAATHLTNYSEVNGAVLIHQPQEMLEGAERSNCRAFFPAGRGHGVPPILLLESGCDQAATVRKFPWAYWPTKGHEDACGARTHACSVHTRVNAWVGSPRDRKS